MTAARRNRWIILLAAAALAGGIAAWAARTTPAERSAAWHGAVSPGPLSAGHAFLNERCSACHKPNRGVDASNCIVCHANDQNLLQRQPTAFHANIRSCVECHVEHEPAAGRVTRMDHAALARIGARRLGNIAARQPARAAMTPDESSLNCAVCHANQDRHRGLFGTDCVQCHGTSAWTIAEYRHPSPTSTSCAQCHQAPPSHYMMHFEMVSMTIAHQEHARVDQCYLCHQTNDWNDIKNVGWYKHH
jgi:hypothetical protein